MLFRSDSSKAKRDLAWKPKVKYNDLVKIMVDSDLERWTKWKKGEHFPWDAYNYIDENKLLFRKFNKI